MPEAIFNLLDHWDLRYRVRQNIPLGENWELKSNDRVALKYTDEEHETAMCLFDCFSEDWTDDTIDYAYCTDGIAAYRKRAVCGKWVYWTSES